MGRIVCMLACLGVVSLVPAALTAQDGAGVADRGSRGILVGWGGTTSVGVWFRLGARTDMGLEGFFSVADADTDVDAGTLRILGVRPAVKGYLRDDGASVAPYWIGGFFFEHSKSDVLSLGDRRMRSIGGFVGLGLDWFPAERVSIGGHVGLEGAATRTTQPPIGFPPGPDETTSGYQVGTLSSGIRLHLWF